MKNRKLRFIRAVYLREPRKLVFQFCGSADFVPRQQPDTPAAPTPAASSRNSGLLFNVPPPRSHTPPASQLGVRRFTRLG